MNDEQLVRAAADALTAVYGPQWPAWVKLRRLSMLSMHRCVLAQVETKSGLSPPPGPYHDKTPFGYGLRRLYNAGVTDTRGFAVSLSESTRQRRVAWKQEIRKRRS